MLIVNDSYYGNSKQIERHTTIIQSVFSDNLTEGILIWLRHNVNLTLIPE